MYFQQRYLKENAAFESTKCLETVDLPNSGLLSGLELRVFGTCGAGDDKPDVWLHDRLTKIEVIVNGSKVVKSFEGNQLLADMLHKKTPLYGHDAKNLSSGMCEELFYINLGRHYHDPDYMLDLSKVNDPELRIEADFTLTGQNGWTNGVAMSAAPSYNLVCHLLRGADFVPKGYIKTSEVARFTGGSAKKMNMKVPRGPVYSNLYLQSWYASQGLGYILDKLELNINNDAVIPIRVGVQELEAELARMYGLVEVSQWAVLKGGQAYPFPLESGHVAGLVGNGEDAQFCFSNLWGNLSIPYFMTTSSGAADTGNHGTHMLSRGALPFSVAAIPYFNPWDERTWVKSAELGDFWLRVEGNTNMGTSVVVKLLADEVVTEYTAKE